MASKKGTYKATNPAITGAPPQAPFMTNMQRDFEESTKELPVKKNTPDQPQTGYKPNPEYIETKSKRVQLLLQPSTVESLKAKAKEDGLSMNEEANKAILNYLNNETAEEVLLKLAKYYEEEMHKYERRKRKTIGTGESTEWMIAKEQEQAIKDFFETFVGPLFLEEHPELKKHNE